MLVIILSETGEGGKLAQWLSGHGFEVIRLVPSQLVKGLNRESNLSLPGEINILLPRSKVSVVVDVSHPLPIEISKAIENLEKEKQVKLIQYLREETQLPDHPLIYRVNNWTEAARKASELGETIFLTTGSYKLEEFLAYQTVRGKRVVVRVLPEHRVIKKCQDLGIPPRDIMAMQGPFSRALNREMFRSFKAGVIVTKDSGPAGGTDVKISAALDLKIPIVIIKRLPARYPVEARLFGEVLDQLKREES